MITTELPYVFYNQQGHKFEISLGVVGQMAQFIQRLPGTQEAGGVMLGRFIIGTEDVVVDKITRPMSEDIQHKFRYFRSRRLHQAIITDEWETSGGTCNYLGEWHTHPEPYPKPSIIDKAGWKKRLINDKFDSENLYFVIVGIEKIEAWQGYRKKLNIEKLLRFQ